MCATLIVGQCFDLTMLDMQILLCQRRAINFARGHFWKAAFCGGPYLLMEIEASLWQVSLSTKLEEILDLKIFSERFRGPLKTLRRTTCGPRAANCPLLSYANVCKGLSSSAYIEYVKDKRTASSTVKGITSLILETLSETSFGLTGWGEVKQNVWLQ